MGTDEANAAMDAEKEAPTPSMSNLDAGAEGFSLAPSQLTVSVATAPHH